MQVKLSNLSTATYTAPTYMGFHYSDLCIKYFDETPLILWTAHMKCGTKGEHLMLPWRYVICLAKLWT